MINTTKDIYNHIENAEIISKELTNILLELDTTNSRVTQASLNDMLIALHNRINKDGSVESTTNVKRMREHLISGGLVNNGKEQEVCDMKIYPQKYFFPYDYKIAFNSRPQKAYSIHHATGSWKKEGTNTGRFKWLKICFVNKLRNIVGTDFIEKIKGFL